MRTALVVLALFLPGGLCLSQTAVDRVTSALDSLGSGTITGWEYCTDPGIAPGSARFDAAAWSPLSIDQRLMLDSCWMRATVVLPDRFLGSPVSGRVRLLVTVDDFGDMYIDGALKGRFPWDGEFELTGAAIPGTRFSLVIRAHNTGGPMRLLRARLDYDAAGETRALIDNLVTSLRVGQKLCGFDTYQTNARVKVDPGIDNSRMDRAEKTRLLELLQTRAASVDVAALASGDMAGFRESVAAVRKQLAPVGAFARRYTLFFTANAHIDAAWLWRSKETVEVCKNTFSSVFNIMDARPGWTYTQSSALYYRWMEERFPDLFEKIRERVKDGRWEAIGGMWIEPDCNLPAGESWMRQLLYAKRYFREKFGVDVTIGWNPDSFGYNGNMPEMYRDAGIDAFITQKIGWNEVTVFPHRVFWWESADGSRILSCFPFDYVNTVEDPLRLVDWLRQYDANSGFEKMLVLFGVGDHGGGPSIDMIDRVEHLRKLDIYPSIEYGTCAQYISWLRSHDLSSLPVWKDELYLEYHQGTFTTQAQMKKNNRGTESLLNAAEKFSAIAGLSGYRDTRKDLATAWDGTMLNQFHDILPGSSIREVYIDAADTYRDVRSIGTHVLDGALAHVAARVNTSSCRKGRALLVFNTLAWNRTDVVAVPLPDGDTDPYVVLDAAGREIPSQIVQDGRYARTLLFIGMDVPSLGYKTYELRKSAPSSYPVPFTITESGARIESPLFDVRLDAGTGWLTSVKERKSGREVLSGPGNRLQLLEDVPSAWDAWNIGLTGVEYPSTFRGIETIEQGPVRTVIRARRDFLKPGIKKEYPTEDFPSSFFSQDVILYNGIPRVEFRTNVDWWEDHVMLKAAFPLAIASDTTTYDIPFGAIARRSNPVTPIEKAKTEVPALRWADMSQADFGVSLLTRGKDGFDARGGLLRLSLLRSPKWPDPTADRGKNTIDYALYPHEGDWRTAGTERRGYEFNAPLIPVLADAHTGSLPMQQTFVRCEQPNIVIASIKRAEDDDAWVMQFYEAHGTAGNAVIHFAARPARAVLSSVMEDDKGAVRVKGDAVIVPVSAHSLVTVKVYF